MLIWEVTLSKVIEKEIASITKNYDVFYGYINQPFINPDKVLKTQSNGKGIKLYDEVMVDPQVSSTLQTRILAVAGKEWDVVPVKHLDKNGKLTASDKDKQIADFVKTVLSETNIFQFKQEILKGILYGYYVAEVMWKYNGNDIVVDKFYGKHPRRFLFNWFRKLKLLTLKNPIQGEDLPDRKFVVFTFGDSSNPYGQGLGQKLWWPVWFKKHGIKYWLVFLEKYGMPTVVGKYPRGTDENEKATLYDAIDAIQTETGITIPDDVAIDLLEATRQGNTSYDTLCNYMDSQISKVVLGQTLTTDVGKTGSYAASKTHNDVRQDIVLADAKLLDETINNSVVKWLVDYNFPNVIEYPKYITHAGTKADLTARSAIDEKLVKIGVKIPQQYFYDTYNLPKPEEGQDIVTMPAKATPGFSEFAEAAKDITAQQIIDNYAEQAAIKAEPLMNKIVQQLTDKIKKAKSFDEVGQIIYSEYPNLDSNRMQELLTRAMLAAGIQGYGAANED